MVTPEEEKIRQDIRAVYNSGDCARAVEMANDFIQRFPKSRLARYSYAVMHGDWSYSPVHSPSEKSRLIEIAKKGVAELLNDPEFKTWPMDFQFSVRNEHAWFFELPEEQYKIGLERLQSGGNGHYSACVGASMVALNKLKQSSIEEAEQWAKRSLHHFAEFEKLVPDWYNINFFSAQALACLGRYDEALACYKDMYRKQKSAENPAEITEFRVKLQEIKNLRQDS